MTTKLWAIGLAFLCALLVSIAQIFLKMGAGRLPEIITNWPAFLGLVIYGFGFIALMMAFKEGEVTVIFPIVATSYIFVTVFAMLIFNEPISYFKWLGVLVIFIGVILIGVNKK